MTQSLWIVIMAEAFPLILDFPRTNTLAYLSRALKTKILIKLALITGKILQLGIIFMSTFALVEHLSGTPLLLANKRLA